MQRLMFFIIQISNQFNGICVIVDFKIQNGRGLIIIVLLSWFFVLFSRSNVAAHINIHIH